jgi:hypothetical protein
VSNYCSSRGDHQVIDKSVSRRVTLEAYNFEVFGDQVTFSVSDTPNGNNTWNGLSTPSVVVFDPAENGPALVVAVRSIYFNGGLQSSGLVVTFNAPGLRVVDPVNTYNGSLLNWPPFMSGAGSLFVDWGDSGTDNFVLSPAGLDPLPEHTYAGPGIYTVTATTVLDDGVRLGGAPFVSLDVEVVDP